MLNCRGAKVSIALNGPVSHLDIAAGTADGSAPLTPRHWMEHASLSKTVASVFATQYFADKGIPLTESVNVLLARTDSPFRLRAGSGMPESWADRVQLRHLMDHSGLGMHYVHGVKLDTDFPPVLSLIGGKRSDLGYEAIEVNKEPGTCFGYSGGGFLVLQHLIEEMEGVAAEVVCRPFLDIVGLSDFSFDPRTLPRARGRYALGFSDAGNVIAPPVGRLAFPAFAAGALGTPRALANFWAELIAACADPEAHSPIAHGTAMAVLRDYVCDVGSVEFMGAYMGLGVFVMDAGPNKVAVHQAANEGFRGVYIACFEGPDAGKVMVVLSNGDNNAALLNAEVARLLLRRWEWQGINMTTLDADTDFAFHGIPQEQIVNQAYKALVFSAFQPGPSRPSTLKRSLDPNPDRQTAKEAS